jgi:mono/diheme cytochrome c family protein
LAVTKTLLIVAVAAFLTTTARAQQPASESQKPAATGSASLGSQLYLDYSCWACHGYNAQTGNGPRLLPPRFTERQFTLYLRTPRTRQMPAYTAKVLSDADVAHIYAYILSLPREPQLKDVPLLTQLPK